MTYVGSVSNVQFVDSSKQPRNADKVIFKFIKFINAGIYDENWFDMKAFGEYKDLIAKDGNVMYFGEEESQLDAEGFPTKLDIYSEIMEP